MEENKTSSTPNKVENLHFNPKDIEDNKAIACLSYVGILFLIPLLAKKESAFAQAHAKQGLALFIVDVVISILAAIPIIGWLLAIGIFIVSLIGVIQTLQGKFWKIPGLYDLSKKINI